MNRAVDLARVQPLLDQILVILGEDLPFGSVTMHVADRKLKVVDTHRSYRSEPKAVAPQRGDAHNLKP